MSTVGQVADRVFREWLHGPDEQPVLVPLTIAVDADDDTFTVNLAVLAPEEQELLAVGLIAEVGTEQTRITDVDTTNSTITVTRGVNGTLPAAHAIGDLVSLSPSFSRLSVVEAICDEVPRLYPELYHETSVAITSSSTYVEAPAAMDSPVKFWWSSGNQWNAGHVSLLKAFPESSTGKAVTFRGVPPGKAGHLVYRGAFTRPDSETDELSDFGVERSWEAILAVGAAAAQIASEDIDKATVEWVSRSLEAQQFPTGSGARIRDSLLRYREYLLDAASRRQRAANPTNIITTDPSLVMY